VRFTLALAATLSAATVLAYSNCWNVPFQFDDFDNIATNRGIRTLVLPPGMKDRLASRPVGRWTLWLNYSLHELDVRGYHALNVAVHLAAALALFGLARRSLQLPAGGGRSAGEAAWLAFAIALLWSLHPLQTQSVTYLIQRFESLMGLFALLSLYCLARTASAEQVWPWQLAAVIACWLSVGSKEVGAAVPILALAFDRVFLSHAWREVARQRWWMYAAMFASLGWLWLALGANPALDAELARAPTSWEYFRSQPGIILHYLQLAAWPDSLVLDYHWPVARHWSQIVPAGLLLTALFLGSLIALWRRPALGFVGFSFFVVLAPTSSFLPIYDLAFEHRMYLALAVPITLFVLGLDLLVRKSSQQPELSRRWVVSIAGAIAILLATRTYVRNHDWRDPVRLWGSNVQHRPASRRALGNYAKTLTDAGRHEEAIAIAERALKLSDDDHWLCTVYGAALLKSKRYREAEIQFKHALRFKLNYDHALLCLGQTYEALGETEKAEATYAQLIEAKTDSADGHDGLARMLAARGSDAEALPHFQLACELDEQEPLFAMNLGSYYARRKQLDLAEHWFQESIRREPDFAQGYLSLALTLFERGDYVAATRPLVALRRLAPQSAAASELLARIEAAERE
jgi:tetratricopeptide (TPR) repeat protein